MDIKALAEKYNDYIIEQRRYLHAHPELSFEEFETTKYLVAQLEEMGLEVLTFPDYNGCIGYLRTGKGGKTVMLRADIDALPVLEKTELPFCSVNEGKMHACGHDAHMAMLLGSIKILVEKKDELQGDVAFMFQAAEESCYGAKYYVEKGVLEGIDAIIGMHIWAAIEAPYINVEAGGRMASCDNFVIKIKGLTAHGSAPHHGHDAVVAAASVLMNLQTFCSRVNDPLNTLVVSVGKVEAGQRFNIVSGTATLEGTVRTYSRELRLTIEEQLKQIIDGTCMALGCTAEFQYDMYPGPIINEHDNLNRIAKDAVIKLYGEEALVSMPKLTGSEDFAYFMEQIPGIYLYIGSNNKEKGYIYTNHNDKYTVDEDSLERGAALYAQFAMDFLAE